MTPEALIQMQQRLLSSLRPRTPEKLAVASAVIHKLSSAKTEAQIPPAKAEPSQRERPVLASTNRCFKLLTRLRKSVFIVPSADEANRIVRQLTQ